MLTPDLISKLTEKFEFSINQVSDDLAKGDVGPEPDFSGQFCGAVKRAVNEKDSGVRGVTLKARQLNWYGKDSEETQTGADLIIVLNYDLVEYKSTKGVLVQSKNLKSQQKMPPTRYADLRDQCQKMQKITASSYVFIYKTLGIRVYSSNIILASRPNNLLAHETYSSEIFFS